MRRMRRTPANYIRLYTYQHRRTLSAAMERGYLTGSEDHAFFDADERDHMAWPYTWMLRQMATRLPAYSGDWPVWAYIRRPSWRKFHRSWSPESRRDLVRITAVVPCERALLSDLDLWHLPLNHAYLSLTEAEDEAVNQFMLSRERIEESWQRIFDIDRAPTADEIRWIRSKRPVIQACVDRIYLTEIVSVRDVMHSQTT
ncbi:DUF3841 domain-containing protein [Azospirillum brasilense]|nr:DUF3841 domain-containing protein [Azospirillum brasilense]